MPQHNTPTFGHTTYNDPHQHLKWMLIHYVTIGCVLSVALYQDREILGLDQRPYLSLSLLTICFRVPPVLLKWTTDFFHNKNQKAYHNSETERENPNPVTPPRPHLN